MSKKTNGKKDHYGAVSWYSVDHWLLNGFLLPGLAYSALCDLMRLGRFHDVDSAIREGIRIVLDENTPLLVRSDRKWLHQLSRMDDAFKEVACAKPDEAGAENLRRLNEMYEAMRKAEDET
jgi:Arc/MetJ-type ribon-helix-helix transcriptional regulator